jgi:PadR family transcriptional regulator, regulatory protein PadR
MFRLTIYALRRIVINLGMSKPSDLIQGTLDLLILTTISLEPKHGWAIGKRIQQVSDDVLQVTQGALYPALHRLEQQGWIRSEWRTAETGREAKFYTLTKAGRTQLEKEVAQWERLSNAVSLVVRMA